MNAMPQRCQECLVRETSLCSTLEPGELAALSEIGRRRILPAGHVVSWAGDESRACANVVSGALKVTASTADGREQIVGILYPGDFVGEPFSDETSLTVATLTDSDLCSFSRAGFARTLDASPRMERMLLRRTLRSLDDARDRMLALAKRSARERVAGFILELSERTGSPAPWQRPTVQIPMSRGEMADWLGLTIETVSRQLTKLKAEGVIMFAKGERDCTIVDRARLAGIARPA